MFTSRCSHQSLDVHISIAHFLNLSLLLPCDAALPFPEPHHSLLQCFPFNCQPAWSQVPQEAVTPAERSKQSLEEVTG